MLIRPAVPTASTACGAIAVMSKASHPGQTKTRLSPPLSLEQAAELNTAFLKDISGNLALAARQVPLARYMAFGPAGSASFFVENLDADVGLLETWLPDFGDCLAYALQSLFDLGYGAACVLNSDSPTLPTAILVAAVETLRRPGDRIVLGPSTDGGYYLLGMQRLHRGLFEHIAWSTAAVAQQTIDRAARAGLETVMLPTWYDVDDGAALDLLAGEMLAGRPFSSTHAPYDARHARSALRRYWAAGAVSADLSRLAVRG